MSRQGRVLPDFMKSEDEFLQFLYDLNIVCYFEFAEDERFIRWCFLERRLTNISPKVKTHSEYEIHYSLANVLNTGKRLRRRSKTAKTSIRAEPKTKPDGHLKWFSLQRGSVVSQRYSNKVNWLCETGSATTIGCSESS
jgi:hypothetical protein